MKLWRVEVRGNVYVVAPTAREAEAFATMEPDILFDAPLSATAHMARRAGVSAQDLGSIPFRSDADADEMTVASWLTQMEEEEKSARELAEFMKKQIPLPFMD